MRPAANISPSEIAWSSFDREMLALVAMYGLPMPSQEKVPARLEQSIKVARLWNSWRDLYLEEAGNG